MTTAFSIGSTTQKRSAGGFTFGALPTSTAATTLPSPPSIDSQQIVFTEHEIVYLVHLENEKLAIKASSKESDCLWEFWAAHVFPVSNAKTVAVSTLFKMLKEKDSQFFSVAFPRVKKDGKDDDINLSFTLAGPFGLKEQSTCEQFSLILHPVTQGPDTSTVSHVLQLKQVIKTLEEKNVAAQLAHSRLLFVEDSKLEMKADSRRSANCGPYVNDSWLPLRYFRVRCLGSKDYGDCESLKNALEKDGVATNSWFLYSKPVISYKIRGMHAKVFVSFVLLAIQKFCSDFEFYFNLPFIAKVVRVRKEGEKKYANVTDEKVKRNGLGIATVFRDGDKQFGIGEGVKLRDGCVHLSIRSNGRLHHNVGVFLDCVCKEDAQDSDFI